VLTASTTKALFPLTLIPSVVIERQPVDYRPRRRIAFGFLREAPQGKGSAPQFA
jgi:hypothetical protein